MASVTDNMDNNSNSKNISETNIDTNLSTRRQREHLQIDATKIQESWEEKQVGNNMAVHGPFEPSSLSKEKIKSLAHIGDVANKNSVKTVAKNQEEEDDLDEANAEIKRRPSGFWRYVNGCFGGNSSKKQPIKPRAPQKISSNTVDDNIERKVPTPSPQHKLKQEFVVSFSSKQTFLVVAIPQQANSTGYPYRKGVPNTAQRYLEMTNVDGMLRTHHINSKANHM